MSESSDSNDSKSAAWQKKNSNFYDYFRSETRDGCAYNDHDYSSSEVRLTALSEDEVAERKYWNNKFSNLENHYFRLDMEQPAVTSREQLLQQRMVFPKLADANVTTRTKDQEARAGRLYPPPSQLKVWDMGGNVFEYQVEEGTDELELRPRQYEVFTSTLVYASRPCRSEKQEESHILEGLKYLETAKIIGEICIETGSVGKPDFVLRNDAKQLSMVVESKSTHNLLLPTAASDLVDKYQVAYEDVVTNQAKRTQEWSHIAHPIAQLLGYMVDNKRRYGALTSGTRTYFLHISDNNAATTVHISEPYFVGEEGYLRAWAYVHFLGCKQRDTFKIPTKGRRKWLKSSKEHLTPQKKHNDRGPRTTGDSMTNKRKRGGVGSSTQTNKRTKKTKKTSVALHLPRVDFHDLIFGEELGFGRNGSVFEVRWEGKQYALKQFDVGKHGDTGFEHELAAYDRTRNAWGKLVPRPYFLSETPSGGVKLLGLQLGRKVAESDGEEKKNEMLLQWKAALDTLEIKYCVQHNDAEGRNAIIVKHNGHDQAVVIDFEDWIDVRT